MEKEYTLKISKAKVHDSSAIIVEAIKKDRFEHHGFGTFLKDIDPKEVEITRSALNCLIEECGERSGLQGLDFWPNRMLAWGDPNISLIVPIEDINCPTSAKEWIKEFDVKEDE